MVKLVMKILKHDEQFKLLTKIKAVSRNLARNRLFRQSLRHKNVCTVRLDAPCCTSCSYRFTAIHTATAELENTGH